MFQDTIKKAERILSCSSCQWDQFCIKPPVMTSEQVHAEVMKERPGADASREKKEESFMGSMLTMMMFSGKDSTCPACPKFIEELRKDDTLIRKIKALMKESC